MSNWASHSGDPKWPLSKIDQLITSLCLQHFKKWTGQREGTDYEQALVELKNEFWEILDSPIRYQKYEKTLIVSFEKLYEMKMSEEISAERLETTFSQKASESFGKIYDAFLNKATIQVIDQSIFGNLSPIDYFTLVYYVTTCGGVFREYIDGLLCPVISGVSSSGKTTISSVCYNSAVAIPLTDRGVSRFDCLPHSKLFLLPDIPITAVFRTDNFTHLKSLLRAENFSIKTRGVKKNIRPHFCLIVSNDSFFPVEGHSAYSVHSNKILEKIDQNNLQVIQNRLIQISCSSVPSIDVECFNDPKTFIDSHAFLHLRVLEILQRQQEKIQTIRPKSLISYIEKALEINSKYVPLSILREFNLK